MILKASGQHYGICVPFTTEIVLFFFRNSYKIAVLVQFSTFVLALANFLPHSFFANAMLKRLLVFSAILRFVNIDPETGSLAAISRKDLDKLLHFLVIIGALEIIMYEKGMLMRAHKRKIAEKTWRENAIEKGQDELEDFEESKKNEKAMLDHQAKTNEKAAKIQA